MSDESTEHSRKVIDRKILNAIRLIRELPDTLRDGADEATMADVEAWIATNKPELVQRIHELSRFLGLPIDPDEDAELKSLMQPIVPDVTGAAGVTGQEEGVQPQGDRGSPNLSSEAQRDGSDDTV